MKIVLKVKTRYIEEKLRKMPDKTLEFVSNITDDDLVRLDLFDLVLT